MGAQAQKVSGHMFGKLLKTVGKGAVRLVTGTRDKPKQRGVIVACIALAVSFLMIKFLDVDTETARELTDYAISFLPRNFGSAVVDTMTAGGK